MAHLHEIDGAFMKRVRKEIGWSQQDMSEYLGCSKGSIFRFEAGDPIRPAYQKLILSLHEKTECSAEEHFEEYCRLSIKAQASHKIEDAIAAGKAWGMFMHTFNRVSP